MSQLIKSRKSANGSNGDSRRAGKKTVKETISYETISHEDLIGSAQVADIINQLPGDNLLQIDSKTNFYQSWPIGKEWQTVKNTGAAGLGRLLPGKERQAIAQELESIEAKFNDCLQQIEPTKFPTSPKSLSSLLKRVKKLQERICNSEEGLESINPFEQELEGIEAKFKNYLQGTSDLQIAPNSALSFPLSMLLKRVKELQERIYHPQGALHLTYPFFLPVFTLHLALIQATAKSIEDGQESLNTLVFSGISYLRKALDSAYREKYDDIDLKRGGARNELGYVEDTRNHKSLTQWVDYAENQESLKALNKHLSAKIALSYVEKINFSSAWSVIDEFVKLLPVAQGETEVVSIQKLATAKIAQWKQASETTTQADTFNSTLLIPTAYDESIIPEDPDAADYVKEYYKTLAIGLIGDIPIPGAGALSAITGLFVGWIFGGEQDKWKTYAQAIGDYIDEQIVLLETTDIENDLIWAEGEFDYLCRFLEEEGWDFGQPLSDDLKTSIELETRFIDLIDFLGPLRQSLYNPASPTYTTFPYFDRLFTLYGAVLGTVTTTLSTYDTYNEFQELFESSRKYLKEAIESAVDYRSNAIEGKWSGAANNSRFYDNQSYSWFSDKRPLNGTDSRWDGFYDLWYLFQIELGYVYPNRLKMLAGLHNFDNMAAQYNDFWSSRKSDHVAIEPLWDWWYDTVEAQRGRANSYRGYIDDGYSSWSNGPGVHEDLYFAQHCYASHFYGPKLYNEGSSGGDEVMFLALTDYPRAQDVIPLESFSHVDISSAYEIVVYSEENYGGTCYTFHPNKDTCVYRPLSACGFTIKSLKINYIKSH